MPATVLGNRDTDDSSLEILWASWRERAGIQLCSDKGIIKLWLLGERNKGFDERVE